MRPKLPRPVRRAVLAGVASSALLAGLSAAPAIAGSVAFYRRPMATVRAASRAGLRLSGVAERTVEVDGLPVRYFDAAPQEASSRPRGEAIVLIHGFGDSAETWARVMPPLAGEHRVLAPDLAGFGRNPIPQEGMSFSTLVRYLGGFLDALGIERAVLVGNSLGGAVAIRYAATHPGRVTRLFLLNSAGLLDEIPPMLEPETRETARELVHSVFGPEAPAPRFLLNDLIREARDPARLAYVQSSDQGTDVRGDLGRVNVPTTIVWGELDRLIPPDHGTALHEAIPGSELIVLPGIGHAPQVQAPIRVLKIIGERL